MLIKKLSIGVMVSAMLLLTLPSLALADEALNLATAVGAKNLQVIPGTAAYGKIYFYNVDGTKTTYITMEALEFPDGWEVEFIPALNTIQVSLGGPPIPVEQNLYVEPSPVYSTDDINIPAGLKLLTLPNKLGEGIPGYALAKVLNIKITVPDSVAVGTTGKVSIRASAAYLGQTGTVIIGLERPFDFTVTTVYEITEEQIITPGEGFDTGKWLPWIILGVVAVAAIASISVLALRRREG